MSMYPVLSRWAVCKSKLLSKYYETSAFYSFQTSFVMRWTEIQTDISNINGRSFPIPKVKINNYCTFDRLCTTTYNFYIFSVLTNKMICKTISCLLNQWLSQACLALAQFHLRVKGEVQLANEVLNDYMQDSKTLPTTELDRKLTNMAKM